MRAIEVTELYTYPIKSCAGVSLQSAGVTEAGLEHDRSFMIVDANGNLLSQRTHPKLAQVVPTIGEKAIQLTAPTMGTLDIPHAEEVVTVGQVEANIHKKVVSGVEFSNLANEWFSSYLSGNARLIATDFAQPRDINSRYHDPRATNRVNFGDGFPVLLTSQASLDWLNNKNDMTIPMDRFRPNIVVGGDMEPFEEDNWRELAIGNLGVLVARACARCQVTEVDQITSIKGKGVLLALRESGRFGVDTTTPENKKEVFFGQNLNILTPGATVKIGNKVEVLDADEARNFAVYGSY